VGTPVAESFTASGWISAVTLSTPNGTCPGCEASSSGSSPVACTLHGTIATSAPVTAAVEPSGRKASSCFKITWGKTSTRPSPSETAALPSAPRLSSTANFGLAKLARGTLGLMERSVSGTARSRLAGKVVEALSSILNAGGSNGTSSPRTTFTFTATLEGTSKLRSVGLPLASSWIEPPVGAPARGETVKSANGSKSPVTSMKPRIWYLPGFTLVKK
jgi:hypothetical protein